MPRTLLLLSLLTACRASPMRTLEGPPEGSTSGEHDTGTSTGGDTGGHTGGETAHTGDTGGSGASAPRGYVDHVGCDGVWGWALDDDAREVSLRVTVDFGGVSVEGTADQPRPDVCGSSPCDHGFSIDVPAEAQDGSARAVTVRAFDPQSGAEQALGGGDLSCGGGEGEGEGEGETESFTELYREGDSYVRYQAVTDVFEKASGLSRDSSRRMMPIDLHTWSIANFNRDLLMYSHFSLSTASGTTLYEYNDTEGAVHVTLAETERESERGNNHASDLSDYLIAEGDYQISYTLSSDSAGRPSLMLWRQRDGNHFLMMVGAEVTGVEQDSVEGDDGILVEPGETVTRSFTVSYLDEDNALYKSNANGFEY